MNICIFMIKRGIRQGQSGQVAHGVSADGVHAAVDAPQALLSQLGLVLRVIAVAVEDSLHI